MIKRIVAVLTMLGLILSLCGCARPFSNSSINDVAIEHMEQKYEEPFSYAGAAGNSLSGTHQLYVRSYNLTDKRIMVKIDDYRSKDRTFRDNYLMVKYEPDLRESLLAAAKAEFPDVELFLSVADVTPQADFPPDATMEEVLQDQNSYVYATIEVPVDYLESKEQPNESQE